MLVARNIRNADTIYIIDRSTQAHCIGDISSSGFKPLWRGLVERLLECDVLDHVATALPGWHIVEHLGLPIQHTDAGRREHLVS